MALTRSLMNRLSRMHNQQVVVDHPTWEKYREGTTVHCKKLLTGRVIGWSFDNDDDDEPLLQVKYSSDLPVGWREETDNIRLSQIHPANRPIATCQRS